VAQSLPRRALQTAVWSQPYCHWRSDQAVLWVLRGTWESKFFDRMQEILHPLDPGSVPLRQKANPNDPVSEWQGTGDVGEAGETAQIWMASR
jgi:hypothetical protein